MTESLLMHSAVIDGNDIGRPDSSTKWPRVGGDLVPQKCRVQTMTPRPGIDVPPTTDADDFCRAACFHIVIGPIRHVSKLFVAGRMSRMSASAAS